ncbi:hypothetical protein QE152_g27709 [Popillia japonica]|uniref:Uncharacterized protein n=1 Tax=Popillia japonica TaxID=7064 RepID=A0AAW1JUA4_POPJA
MIRTPRWLIAYPWVDERGTGGSSLYRSVSLFLPCRTIAKHLGACPSSVNACVRRMTATPIGSSREIDGWFRQSGTGTAPGMAGNAIELRYIFDTGD